MKHLADSLNATFGVDTFKAAPAAKQQAADVAAGSTPLQAALRELLRMLRAGNPSEAAIDAAAANHGIHPTALRVALAEDQRQRAAQRQGDYPKAR